jgi:hypothetical protein
MYDAGFMAGDLLTDVARPPHVRIRAMLEALLDTVDQHRYLLQAMLEARTTSSAIREVWDDARDSFVPGVAAVIAAERTDGRAADLAPADVVASMLLEFNDRLLERYTLGGRLTRDELLTGAQTIWLGAIHANDGEAQRKAIP